MESWRLWSGIKADGLSTKTLHGRSRLALQGLLQC